MAMRTAGALLLHSFCTNPAEGMALLRDLHCCKARPQPCPGGMDIPSAGGAWWVVGGVLQERYFRHPSPAPPPPLTTAWPQLNLAGHSVGRDATFSPKGPKRKGQCQIRRKTVLRITSAEPCAQSQLQWPCREPREGVPTLGTQCNAAAATHCS